MTLNESTKVAHHPGRSGHEPASLGPTPVAYCGLTWLISLRRQQDPAIGIDRTSARYERKVNAILTKKVEKRGRVAIVGAGISGLATAYYLSESFQITIFERESRVGGHTNTVVVESGNSTLAIDTGFIVFNERTYPNFCGLMRDLGVESQPGDMSFAVYCPQSGFEYSSRGLRGFLAHRRNALSPRHWLLLREILRFNANARAQATDLTLGKFLDRHGYSLHFRKHYLYPMAAAVWSTPFHRITEFPAAHLIRFFDNHGMLGINTHPRWLVIKGGSNEYLKALTARFRHHIRTDATIQSVEREQTGVRLRFKDRPDEVFDHVVFACHGDQVLPMLPSATNTERSVLSCFETTANETVLHTDARMLPRSRAARASWNYRLGEENRVAVTYHMNRLQNLDTQTDYCVTLNGTEAIDPAKILHTFQYRHPLYTNAAMNACKRWGEISGVDRIHFCGAYWFNGFHEDGLNSARRVAGSLGNLA